MKTIIVGSGITGAYLARELSKTDNVTVLEKEDYLGGRILTGHESGSTFEIGAGRIHSTHLRVLKLIKEYGLKTIDIGGTPMWRPQGSSASMPNLFEPTWAALLNQFRKLPTEVLGTTTLKDLCESVLGPKQTKSLLDTFPYRTELESMRADVAIKGFDDTAGTQGKYMVVLGGLTQLIQGLVKDAKANGAVFKTGVEVTDVTEYGVITKTKEYRADRVILCIPVSGLKKLPVLKGLKAFDYVDMAPLTRIYGVYPGLKLDRTVTDSPIRYIIPIHGDLFMISYTDGRDTRRWTGLTGPALTKSIQQALTALFPELTIPEPTWIKSFEWSGGTTYWKPGSLQPQDRESRSYDPVEEGQRVLQPRPSSLPSLYICGESFSMLQAWMEGSLEHADALIDLFPHKE
jgi:monoamine oxidase